MAAGRLVAGRYRLDDRIGSGGMGVVWRAHDNRLDRIVAVKQLLITPGLSEAATDEASRRALREGRIAARLHHPHAIAVYDVAEADNHPWLIMEYLPSVSLAAMLDERPLIGHIETARIGAQVASALAAAHAAGIVHRDVKPANVLIGAGGNVKITDFGISRATGDVTVTATGMVAGTPAFLSPEVARGVNPEPPSDVFSLGSTLYMMVEGHPPFGRSENTLALLHAVAAGAVDAPRNIGPLTPLLTEMLRVDPAERPTMRQVQAGLERVAAGGPAVIAPRVDTPTVANPTVATPTVAQQGPRARPAPRVHAATAIEPAPTTHSTRHAPEPRRRAPQPVAPPKKQRRSFTAVPALVVVGVLAAIAIFVAVIATSDRPNNGSDGSGSTTGTSSETGGTGAMSFDNMSQFVRSYYANLPSDTLASWIRLTRNYQAKTGGQSNYDQFWAGVKSVTVEDVSPRDASSVTVELNYEMTNGSKSTETRWIELVPDVDGLYIEDSGV